VKQEKLILFGNASHYSNAVLKNLLDRGIVPVAVVLPEYAPAAVSKSVALKVDAEVPVNQFIEMASRLSIPIIYAPRALEYILAEKLTPFNPDYMLVACWPYLLSPATVGAVAKVALNLHPSLLPEYPGAAPVIEQLNCKETRLGVTLHVLSQEYDRGDIVAQAGFQLEGGPAGREQIEAQAAFVGTGLLAEFIRGNYLYGS